MTITTDTEHLPADLRTITERLLTEEPQEIRAATCEPGRPRTGRDRMASTSPPGTSPTGSCATTR
jgi:hypothetical protein